MSKWRAKLDEWRASNIICFNTKGSRFNTIQTKSKKCPFEIAVNSDGYLLYADWTTRTVNKVKKGRIERGDPDTEMGA